jgi:hypothetical protein
MPKAGAKRSSKRSILVARLAGEAALGGAAQTVGPQSSKTAGSAAGLAVDTGFLKLLSCLG